MVTESHVGSVAICEASQPTVPDFSCGFQPHLSSGTRSRVVRVFFISWSNSGSMDCPMVMVSPSREDTKVALRSIGEQKANYQEAFGPAFPAFDARGGG